ncbi:MAG: sugar phosphate nucleotidyltransferase, partial [Candidatus Wildermuthbacteria bacterium]|nr:sugar phosphate nucleotidyltransferase [Candidatus Wildermuthbacteria bacterium]
ARTVVGKEPFAVLWGDEFIMAEPPRLAQMIEVYKKYGGAVLSAVQLEKKEQFSRYGIARIEPVENNVFKIKEIVEKPGAEKAPSKFATHGAYILPPEIFDIISDLKPGKNGEIWLVDAINKLIESGFPVYGSVIKNARYYDTGNKLEYLKTVVEFAILNPEIGDEFKEYLKNLKL